MLALHRVRPRRTLVHGRDAGIVPDSVPVEHLLDDTEIGPPVFIPYNLGESGGAGFVLTGLNLL